MTEATSEDATWSDGPPAHAPEFCANCGTEKETADELKCGGCGFSWHEVTAAKKSVEGVCRALGLDSKTLDPLRFRAAMDAVLGEWTPPE